MKLNVLQQKLQLAAEYPESITDEEARELVKAAARGVAELMHRRYLATRALDWQDPVAANGEIVTAEEAARITE